MSAFTIINRQNERVPLDFNKTYNKLISLINMEPVLNICAETVAQKTISMIINGISTYELDLLSSSICASMITEHIDYDSLAVRIYIDSLHKETSSDMLTTVNNITKLTNKNGELLNILDVRFIKFVENYNDVINNMIDYSLDFKFDYFGIQTLCKSYLTKDQRINNNKFNSIIERPQHLWMRVAIGIHMYAINEFGVLNDESLMNDISKVYHLISNKYYTHATPTLFNAGCNNSALSSCFLLEVPDNLNGIYKTLTDSAKISKWSGGVGIAVSKVRAKGSLIKSTNGISEGLVPMMKLFNQSALYVSQGGGKRKGSTAVYLEPWHPDIFDFLNTRRPLGDEATKCKDLFLALWIPDIFMKRLIQAVQLNNTNSTKVIKWSLMCPNESKGLVDTHGNEFEELYLRYENEGRYVKQINILDIWNEICSTQLESGVPYIMYKDHVNHKCNQNNLGTIQSSNLCSEITIYTDENNIGVCNLASVCLGKYIEYVDNTPFYNYKKLYEVVIDVTNNLNKVLYSNFYSIKEGQHSDSENKPLGIGVQGLADVFMQFKVSFTSPEAKKINKFIFETIYYAALTASVNLAKLYGPYKNYEGSMMSKGLLQCDLWNVTPEYPEWDWDLLRNKIKKYGVRNSLLIALMPTASTASIMGSSENFEPLTSNIYARNVLSGKFQMVNKYLIKDLIKLNLWNNEMKQMIIAHNGSIQNIKAIPIELKNIYKHVYEYKLSDLIEMDAARSAYVCQSSSSNRYVSEPTINKLTKMHIHCWNSGLKTSSYYIKTQAKTDAVKFTVDRKIMQKIKAEEEEELEECMVCSA